MPVDQQVMQLQQEMTKAGLNPGPIDGIMGPRTQAALDIYSKKRRMVDVTPEELKAVVDMTYGENGSEDDDTIKMTASTAFNRLMAKRKKEFGGTMTEVLNATNAYYAIKDKKNKAYQQAVSGTLDETGKRRYAEIDSQVRALYHDQKFSPGMFYFKPPEEEKLRKTPKAFNFNAVKPTGKVGKYNVYSY